MGNKLRHEGDEVRIKVIWPDKCHACHAKCTFMSPSATPATQSRGRRRQVPRLPRKEPRRQRRQLGTKRTTRASPVP